MRVRMKSAERRDAIVRSAIHLFAEKGFRGATTRELAAAAGVTEPVLYQHFRTKSDLYSAIIEAKAVEVSGHAAGVAATCAIRGRPRVFRHGRRSNFCGATRRTLNSPGCCFSVRWNATNYPTSFSSGFTRDSISW